jgi:hypothetical protein
MIHEASVFIIDEAESLKTSDNAANADLLDQKGGPNFNDSPAGGYERGSVPRRRKRRVTRMAPAPVNKIANESTSHAPEYQSAAPRLGIEWGHGGPTL